MNEKTDNDIIPTAIILLPSQAPSDQDSQPKSPVLAPRTKTVICIALLILLQCVFWKAGGFDIPFVDDTRLDGLCPQATELMPQTNVKVWQYLSKTFQSDDFKRRAIDWLGGAVRVP
jgi:Gly-Xaa carboxypeptidase